MTMSLKVSNIDQYVKGSVRTDVIEIVRGEQKTFAANVSLDLTNYSFDTKVSYWNASVSYSGSGASETVTINSLNRVASTDDSDFTNIVVVTDAAGGSVEFRIPKNIVPGEIDVPVDSATPLIAMITTTINRDTTASFPTIDKETVLVIVRYAPL